MEPIKIYPEYALILTYDVKQGLHERYFRWITNEFVPSLQSRKIYIQYAWHVVGNGLPARRLEFITESLDALERLLRSTEWKELEDRLKYFTEDYTRKVIRYKGDFKV